MNRSKTRRTGAVVLTFVLVVGMTACETTPKSKFSYSGNVVLCDGPLVGSSSQSTNLYEWNVTSPLNVLDAAASYKLKFKVGDKMYQPDLPQFIFLSYERWRPDNMGVLQPIIGSFYETPLGCSKGGSCKSKHATLIGFNALQGDVIRMGIRIGNNAQGSPAFVRDGTHISLAIKYKFADNTSSSF